MSLFKKTQSGGLMDDIRCDEQSYLIWKWHPNASEQNRNNRENAIRWGSSLRVKDGEVAVFVYKQNDGTMQDYIVGPCDKIIETKNFPVLGSIVGLAYDSASPFQAEIYFINLSQIIQVKFAVPFFDVYDPRFEDFCVPVAVRGTITFKISDYKDFIKLHRLNSFSLEKFQIEIRDAVIRYVKDIVSNAPAAHNIPLVRIETKTSEINDAVEYYVGTRLKENFGVEVSGVDIGSIETDKSSEGYKQLISVTREIESSKIHAQAEDYTERLRIQREEGQYAQHKQTQSANIGAFQVEKQAEIGIAGAEALGSMGKNGVGGVNLGGGGVGFNPVAMMAGMAIGGAVGQNIVGAMNGAVSSSTPPPIPNVLYYIAINSQATGPYDLSTLRQMVSTGQFTSESLVWKSGMSSWTTSGMIDELKSLFIDMPPIPESK